MKRPLHVAVIAPLRFPIRPPHAGGLEAAVWAEVAALRARGHRVTFVAVRGSDFVEEDSVFEMPPLDWPAGSTRTDVSYPSSHATRSLPALDRALDAISAEADAYDVVSNHCLDPLPLQRATGLGVPMVTTLHTPVDESFVRAAAPGGSVFVAVSEHTRRAWAGAGIASTLLPNGVDPVAWPLGPGGGGLVWFGRIVPEKAPHLAIAVARSVGMPLTLAGRVGDRDYADRVLRPLLGNGVTYAGPLAPEPLAQVVGRSVVAIATPAWPEPFGLTAPEALMCGTPVVGFAVGGVPEIAARVEGMTLVPSGDVRAMSAAIAELVAAGGPDRPAIRRSAVAAFSLDARLDALERLFRDLAADLALAGELTA